MALPDSREKEFSLGLLQKQNGKGLMVASQNTDSRPEVPVPAGPQRK
jgi:hypothetical protein